MLIEFSVGNWRSIDEKQTLSLKAASIKDRHENLIATDQGSYLKSAVIYGANSSGKSNLMIGISFMKWFIINSLREKEEEEIDIEPFLLSTHDENDPTYFEILIRTKQNNVYRYGFELTKKEIVSEWLFEVKKTTEKTLFIRVKDKIEITKGFQEGNNLEEKTGKNVLFLTVVSQFNGKISDLIIKWFKQLFIASGIESDQMTHFTFDVLRDKRLEPLRKPLQELFNDLSLGFDRIAYDEKAFDFHDLPKKMPEELKNFMVKDFKEKKRIIAYTFHKKFNSKGLFKDWKRFDLREHESAGTNKIFNLAGAILVTLASGGVLVVDELDSSLHPIMTCAIVRLFNSKEINFKNGQLIFTTHDTNLLTNGHFRRDQIYFTEKDNFEATKLYSLVEYKGNGKTVRNDARLEKNYIRGRYGAIPYIGTLKPLFESLDGAKNKNTESHFEEIPAKARKTKKKLST